MRQFDLYFEDYGFYALPTTMISAAEVAELRAWRAYWEYEASNPQRLPPPELQARMQFVFQQALMVLWFTAQVRRAPEPSLVPPRPRPRPRTRPGTPPRGPPRPRHSFLASNTTRPSARSLVRRFARHSLAERHVGQRRASSVQSVVMR